MNPTTPKLQPTKSPPEIIPAFELPTAVYLSVDYREHDLIGMLQIPYSVKTLPVGDLICKYEDGKEWIAERKRTDDLAKSIKTGRWKEQQERLRITGLQIFFLIEGDLRDQSLSHESLLGACINAELHEKSCVIRSMNIAETAAVVRHLVKKLRNEVPEVIFSITSPMLSRRQKNAERETCYIRQLMCIPSISENIARRLLKEFKTLPDIKRALENEEGLELLKKVRINDNACLGKARIQKLSHYLSPTDEI
eukprot:12431446-Karenia_brevis.AAC.2